MARPVWSGTLSLGLVTVPVALYTATQDHSVPFRQIERGTSDRIRLQRVNERTGDEVEYADVAKGYDTGHDEIVEVEPEELADIAPGRSRSLDIDTFVDLAEIDPVFFDRTYWLGPKGEEYGHAYHLLRDAMAKTGLAGIAMLVMRGRQHLTAVRAGDGVLVLHTMRFADEIRAPRDVVELPKAAKAKPKELDMATELITTMSGKWRPESYRDTYAEQVKELVRDKESGRKRRKTEAPAEPTKVVDLTDALRRSMRRAGNRGAGTMSRADLDERARRLKIKGRSKMSKAELAEAVEQAS
ncbi:MAG TPA: Ku protein [Pseudonocardiaceae bacterium]|jgi:DNA end-binding protein Ku|nr:Ku protein [Pseudonocardiaceae bacterium]